MKLAVVVALVSVAGTARADGIPGTGDDPLHELGLSTSLADAPLLDGISIRGGSAADTIVLLDGFAVPYLWHGRHLRSVIAPGISDASVVTEGIDPAFGRAATFVNIATDAQSPRFSDLRISVFDAGGAGRQPMWRSGMFAMAARGTPFDRVANARHADALGRWDFRLSRRWTLEVSAVGSIDDEGDRADALAPVGYRDLARVILATRYMTPKLEVWVAASGMQSHRDLERGVQHVHDRRDSIDTRIIATRHWDEALGLEKVEWTVGSETNATRYDLDLAMPREARDGSAQSPLLDPRDTTTMFDGAFWTPDVAGYTSLAANVGDDVRITGGVRVDRFGRGDDLATQPRGAIDFTLAKRTGARISAAAFRRPPQQREELLYPDLHPERTTQIAATLHQRLATLSDAYVTGYYIDRSHLIVRDRATETLVNTGRGTSYGVEAIVNGQLGNWFGAASASLASSTRIDYQRGAERPSDFDQPFRLDAMAGYRGAKKNWQLAARVQLASGLPVTPVAAVVYDADGDHHDPLFGAVNSERLPFQHRVDVRFDRVFRIKDAVSLVGVIDLANVYGATTPIGYA